MLAAYLLPYLVWKPSWRFAAGALVILGMSRLAWGTQATLLLGLRATRRDLAGAALLLVATLPASRWVLTEFVGRTLDVAPHATLASATHQFFQVLNDEMVGRALLIGIAIRVLPRSHTVVFLIAGLFAVAHAVFYARTGVWIGTLAIVTLFAFGIVVNTLFLAFQHIWYGFALHFAWNVYRFSTAYGIDGTRLREANSFQYIEGNPWVAAGASITALIVFASYAQTLPIDKTNRDRSRSVHRNAETQ